MLAFLNQNAGAISGLVTVALLFVTIFYAWTTNQLLKEAKQTRLLSLQPRVVGYLRTNSVHQNIAQLHIANLSGAAAVAVSAKIERVTEWPTEFYLEHSEWLRDLSFLRGYETLKFDIGIGPDLYRDEQPAEFQFFVSYQGLDGRQYEFKNDLKIESISGHSAFEIYGLDDIARRAKELVDIVKRITDFRRLRVDTYSSSDRRLERRASEKQRRQRAKARKD